MLSLQVLEPDEIIFCSTVTVIVYFSFFLCSGKEDGCTSSPASCPFKARKEGKSWLIQESWPNIFILNLIKTVFVTSNTIKGLKQYLCNTPHVLKKETFSGKSSFRPFSNELFISFIHVALFILLMLCCVLDTYVLNFLLLSLLPGNNIMKYW